MSNNIKAGMMVKVIGCLYEHNKHNIGYIGKVISIGKTNFGNPCAYLEGLISKDSFGFKFEYLRPIK